MGGGPVEVKRAFAAQDVGVYCRVNALFKGW
jgi:hypothetical protein